MIDYSGSMGDTKLSCATSSAQHLVNQLSGVDSFAVVAFTDDILQVCAEAQTIAIAHFAQT